jgi:1,2-diacylglycerol 3-alpha-glucosyltransferase
MYDLLSIYCRKKGLPLIARHSRDSANCKLNGTKIIFRNWIKKKTLNMADKIIIPSQSERLEVENLGINKNKLVSMQNPIDFNNFHPMPREEAAKILKRDTAYKYLLYVGRLHKNKGIQDVLNILPKLITNHPNIRFLIVGYGPYEDYLNEKVKEKNLQEFVNFEGLVLPENLIYYYNLSDAFVVPSYKDGGPNVIQEAIACNTSSIGTNVGIIPEVLSEGVGKLIDVKDELELFKGINDILNGKFQINQEKRRLLLEEWSLKRYGIQLKNICDEIIK